jgi:geranylgeranyl transferase type-2 subunit beta
MQELDAEVSTRAGMFLRERMTGTASVVDLFSLVMSCYLVPLGGGPDVLAQVTSDWSDRVAGTLESFRSPDGGYGKSPGARSGSTYTSFLVALCLELLGRPIPAGDRLEEFVRSRRRPDGGFVEVSVMKRSGTNPTAAGIGLLNLLNALDDSTRASTAGFLASLVTPIEGGLRANDRIPAADLLSTFTGGWTLDQLGEAQLLDWSRIRDYATACERPIGGFRGGLWDEQADAEYTFYGLGAMAMAELMLN